MSIGLALAGLTAIAVAAHPRGAKRLMGFAGTPEEHRREWTKLITSAEETGSDETRYNDLIRSEEHQMYFPLTKSEMARKLRVVRLVRMGPPPFEGKR